MATPARTSKSMQRRKMAAPSKRSGARPAAMPSRMVKPKLKSGVRKKGLTGRPMAGGPRGTR